MKRIFAFAMVFVMLFSMTSCMKDGFEGADKVFSASGMSITLTENFVETSFEATTLAMTPRPLRYSA